MRIDKYDPISGGFRAPLAADFAAGNVEIPHGVGLNANGQVVLGGGNTGVKGVLVLTGPKNAGDVVDVMTDGEMVEAGLTAGTNYYAAVASGNVGTTNTDTYVGHTVEADRLIVRVAR